MTQLATHPVDAFACTLAGLTATAPDGRTATLDDCCWMITAPCGCVSGVTTAVHGDTALLTADLALRSMSENVADYREDVRNGARAVLVLFEDYRAQAGELFRIDCPHTPRFGVARKQREINGVTWTRIGSTRWTCKYRDAGWSMEKWSNRWHLSGPSQGPGRYRSPWLGFGKLDEALTLASSFIVEHPEGLERVPS